MEAIFLLTVMAGLLLLLVCVGFATLVVLTNALLLADGITNIYLKQTTCAAMFLACLAGDLYCMWLCVQGAQALLY